jgi:DNA replication protein DnaC
VALLHHFIYKICLTNRFDFETPLGLFLEYPMLMDDLRYRRDLDTVVRTMTQVREAPLLLLDDMGAGTMSDFTREQTYLILNHRMNNKLSTIFTTNMGTKQLSSDTVLGKRNMSRLMNNAIGMNLGGKDRRMEGLLS